MFGKDLFSHKHCSMGHGELLLESLWNVEGVSDCTKSWIEQMTSCGSASTLSSPSLFTPAPPLFLQAFLQQTFPLQQLCVDMFSDGSV